MKTSIIFITILAICALLFFVAPHHRRRPDPFKTYTMAELYRYLLKTMPEVLNRENQVMFLLGLAGLFASFYPAILVLMLRWTGAIGGVWFVLLGLIALAGVPANFIGMIMSHMTLGFSSPRTETVFFWIIPAFEAVFALLSIAIGFSAYCSGIATKLVVSTAF